MKRRFAAEQPDTFPADAPFQTVADEVPDGADRNVEIGWGLGTGAVAVITAQIATVGDVDFDAAAADTKRATQPAHHGLLASKVLIEVEQQSLEGDVAMGFYRSQQRSESLTEGKRFRAELEAANDIWPESRSFSTF